MADITDPAAIKFVGEQARPLAEQARALKARIAALSTDWFAGINVAVANTADPVAEGRTDGANALTGADVNSLVGNLIAAHDALNDQIVAKPCVRPLQVSASG